MKANWFLNSLIFIGLVLVIAGSTGLTLAEETGRAKAPEMVIENAQLGLLPAATSDDSSRQGLYNLAAGQKETEGTKDRPHGLLSYQGRLLQGGSPVDGLVNMTFSLYTVSTGGTAWWSETRDVQVDGGLFNVMLGEVTPLDDMAVNFQNQQWLGVQPTGFPELTPRHPLGVVGYAMNLMPGATLVDENPAGVYSYSLWVRSDNHQGIYASSAYGHGIWAQSSVPYQAGAALWAANSDPSGISIWAQNDSADCTLVVGNNGAGPLIKGFGGDGGEDEFRVSNDGKIESKADSYMWFPGNLAMPAWYSGGDITMFHNPNGSVEVNKNIGSGDEGIYIPIVLPGVLYGQNVDVEQVTIYYRCSSANSYITTTWLNKQTGASTQDVIITDGTDRTSTSDSSYSLTPSPEGLSATAGPLNLHLYFWFANNTDIITIGGVRVQLGHHSLY